MPEECNFRRLCASEYISKFKIGAHAPIWAYQVLYVLFAQYEPLNSSKSRCAITLLMKILCVDEKKVSNGLYPDQAPCLVGPDLGPICLKMLAVYVSSCN